MGAEDPAALTTQIAKEVCFFISSLKIILLGKNIPSSTIKKASLLPIVLTGSPAFEKVSKLLLVDFREIFHGQFLIMQ